MAKKTALPKVAKKGFTKGAKKSTTKPITLAKSVERLVPKDSIKKDFKLILELWSQIFSNQLLILEKYWKKQLDWYPSFIDMDRCLIEIHHPKGILKYEGVGQTELLKLTDLLRKSPNIFWDKDPWDSY